MILASFGRQFGIQHSQKWIQKIDKKIDGFLERLWKGSGAPPGRDETVKVRRPESMGRGKGGVNPPWKG